MQLIYQLKQGNSYDQKYFYLYILLFNQKLRRFSVKFKRNNLIETEKQYFLEENRVLLIKRKRTIRITKQI